MTSTIRAELPRDMVTKAYGRWAPVYDVVFGAVFDRGRQAAIEAAERIGGRILEVGVGTGISLPDYKRTSRLCACSRSEEHTSELQSQSNLVCRLLLEKKNRGFAFSLFQTDDAIS